MTNQSLVQWCICLPFLSEFSAYHTLPETKQFTAFPAPYYQSACYKVPPGAHNNAWLMHIWQFLGFKVGCWSLTFIKCFNLTWKMNLYWLVKESKVREIVQLAKSLKHEGLSLITRTYIRQAGACWNAPEILALGRQREGGGQNMGRGV